MVKIIFISVGRMKKSFLDGAVAEYIKRIKRYCPVEEIDVKEESAAAKTPKAAILQREGERILKKIRPGDHVVALSDRGPAMTSKALSGFISGLQDAGVKRLCFVTGGPWGLDKGVLDASSAHLSLSRMTLPHDMARLVLAEQVYRAFTIMRGEPYSH